MLRAENLCVERGGIALLEGLSFTLAAGEALILQGPNGSGKTSLLRSIVGLQPLRHGTVHAAPESLAYASHADGLKSTLTARENLQFWAAIFGTSPARVEAAMAEMNLLDLQGRAAQNLSAGQKRRLGLARILLTERPVWIFDEPTVSLDQASVALFAQMVRGHLARGGAAILATHIDLGLGQQRRLDLAEFRAKSPQAGGARDVFDEAFL